MVDFLSAISQKAEKMIGIKKSLVGKKEIEAAIATRLRKLGFSNPKQYYTLLRRDQSEWQEFIELLVNKETWFFRDPIAFTFVADEIMKTRDRDDNPISILVAPCSTGEEAYSIVMKLLDSGFKNDDVLIDAYDISIQAIDKAIKGEYEKRSFRGKNLEYIDRYFHEDDGKYILSNEIKKPITFSQTNLIDLNINPRQYHYDIVFCRNLLIYLNDSSRKVVLNQFSQLMKPSGVLLVSPSEVEIARKFGFIGRLYHNKLIYLEQDAVPKPLRSTNTKLGAFNG